MMKNFLFPIFKLAKYEKKPACKWSNPENWIKSAEELSNTKPYPTYGLVCGQASGIMVVDLDVNHGETGANGIENFKKILETLSEQNQETVKNTFIVRTPNGGLHFYFKYIEGSRNDSSTDYKIDIRSEGGLIVAPSSKVKNNAGKIAEYNPINDNEIQEMPIELYDKLIPLMSGSQNGNAKNKPTKKKSAAENTDPISPTPSTMQSQKDKFNQGGRNEQLNKLAFKLLVKSTIRKEDEIIDFVRALNIAKCEPHLDDYEVINTAKSIHQALFPEYTNSRGIIEKGLLVDKVKAEMPCYVRGHLFFQYDESLKYYKKREMDDLKTLFYNHVVNEKDRSTNRATEFSRLLFDYADKQMGNYQGKRYINCNNGIIDLETDKLLPHSWKYKTEIKFKGNYIVSDEEFDKVYTDSRLKKYLNTTLQGQDVLTLQETFGLLLSPHAKETQALVIFKGEGSNGKSVAFELMESMVTNRIEHICSIPINNMGDAFALADAEGKQAIIVHDDNTKTFPANDNMKALITGEPIPVNKKGENIRTLEFNTLMCYGMNRLPNTPDKSHGFYRRIAIIPFYKTFGTLEQKQKGEADEIKDVHMAKSIIEYEQSILLSWAYRGLKRLKSNNWEMTLSDAAAYEKEEYKEETDSALFFFKEQIIKTGDPKHMILPKTLFKCYEVFCEDESIKPLARRSFITQIKKIGIHTKKSGVEFFVGIAFKKDISEDDELKAEPVESEELRLFE